MLGGYCKLFHDPLNKTDLCGCSTFAASSNCQPMLSCFKNYVLSSNGIVMKVDRLVMLFLNADAIDEEWLSP
jgi:hypothetical protein